MPRAERRAAGPFSILTVCTGNVCRSPLAEQLLRARLVEAGFTSVEVASAGLHAVVGAPMDTIPAQISSRLGGDPSRARGQQLTSEMVAASDLLLTMTRSQRDHLVSRYPSAVHRSFTLVEFARLLGPAGGATASVADMAAPAAASERLQSVVASAGRKRPSVRLTDDDDVTDPIGRPDDVHEAVGEQISLATSRIVFGLR